MSYKLGPGADDVVSPGSMCNSMVWINWIIKTGLVVAAICRGKFFFFVIFRNVDAPLVSKFHSNRNYE